ncbi:10457_t:CDS:2 [Acaulospora morrowiae]|uniref:10457_t:CDS:1 n=1 Tax=Acaulospora morrowiae TaxID=94023 RepID=A0A9N9FIP0_9GLOM|nr:10457_t:CDS:2 [Acaulospora morrowiae]
MCSEKKESSNFGLLDIVKQCDNFPYPEETVEIQKFNTTPLILNDTKIGLLLPSVIQALRSYNEKHESPSPFVIKEDLVTFSPHVNTFEKRTKAIEQLLNSWRTEKTFSALKGWRDELYPVYGDPSGPSNMAFVIERAATPLFGVLTFGVHLTGFVKTKGHYRIWVAKRSKTKPTWPGYLDNTVAGGIPYNLSITESIIKEAMEEANLPREIAKDSVPAGAITYFTVTERGLQPEAQYIYDLELPIDVVPKPFDDEVECFYLWDISKVIDHIKAGEFKPNCALDFLIRHSIITPDKEPAYLDILYRLHRRHEFPGPSFQS